MDTPLEGVTRVATCVLKCRGRGRDDHREGGVTYFIKRSHKKPKRTGDWGPGL